MPGVAVYTVRLQPLPSVVTTLPCLGLSLLTPSRSSELPYEYTSAPAVVGASATPLGPPKPGTVGSTLPASAGSIFTRARSLKAHVSAFDSCLPCMVIQEL